MNQFPVTGLLFAGGRSSRMGQDKTQLLLEGKPLVALAAEKLHAVFQEVFLLGPMSDSVAGIPMLPDFPEAKGPLAGLIAGMETASHSWVFAFACDMPMITAEMIQKLAEYSLDSTQQVILPIVDEQPQYLCSLWHISTLPVLKAAALSGDFALKRIIPKLSTQFLPVHRIFGNQTSEAFLNINTPEDYTQLRKLRNNGH